MLDVHCYSDFGAAARAVLQLLHQRLGFGLWMVTRKEGEDWIVLQAEDHGYGVKEGHVFNWADSFCSQMVLGRGPCIAPVSASIPAYAAAPIGQQVSIGAYVGVPLTREDGSLFGTLCAIDPIPQPETISSELAMVQVLARLLSTILESDLVATEQIRRADRAEAEAMMDPLTHLYNRRGWDKLLMNEESRCRRYGLSACVISIDLDELKRVNDTEGHAQGDELIRRAATAIQNAVRDEDVVARVGGDEFVVLGIECDASRATALQERVAASLVEANIQASSGIGIREPGLGLIDALAKADQAMYACKKIRRRVRSVLPIPGRQSLAEDKYCLSWS